jgi:hypothetical protein
LGILVVTDPDDNHRANAKHGPVFPVTVVVVGGRSFNSDVF